MSKRKTIEKLVSLGLSTAEISKQTGAHERWVRRVGSPLRRKLQGLEPEGLPPAHAAVPPEPPTYDADKDRLNQEYWKSEASELRSRYKKALKEAALVDRLISDIHAVAPASYRIHGTPPVVKKADDDTNPVSAVLMLSDSHVGKEVQAGQTLGFGGYTNLTYLDRLQFLEDSVVSIAHDHTYAPVNELVVLLLGDIIDGALIHSVEAGQVQTLFGQYFVAAHSIAQFLRNLAQHFPIVRVETVVGNHPRWANQKKMPTTNRYSNLDMFVYATIQALVKDVPNIHIQLDKQPFKTVQVQNSVLLIAHGDHLRGGDKALGIPAHAIGRQLSNLSQLFGKNELRLPNFYCFGDKHKEMTLPHANGKIFMNGSFVGLDNYALAENFAAVDPEQKLFFIHPKYHLGAQYAISLKHAPVGGARYDLPEGLLDW